MYVQVYIYILVIFGREMLYHFGMSFLDLVEYVTVCEILRELTQC